MTEHGTVHFIPETPLIAGEPAYLTGAALSLYAWLMTEANARGIVCRESSTIAKSLDQSESEIFAWCERLATARLITILTPSPHLVIKIPLWPAHAAESVASGRENRQQSEPSREYVPVSRLKPASKAAADINNHGVGVPGGGGDLAAELTATLGAAAAEAIRTHLAEYPARVVRTALARVRATPDEKIRKSRLALFRYLLKTLHDASPHAHDDTLT